MVRLTFREVQIWIRDRVSGMILNFPGLCSTVKPYDWSAIAHHVSILVFFCNGNSASAIVHLPNCSWVREKSDRYWVHGSSSCVFCWSLNVEFLNDSSRAPVKSIRACDSEWLCVIALAVRGEIRSNWRYGAHYSFWLEYNGPIGGITDLY